MNFKSVQMPVFHSSGTFAGNKNVPFHTHPGTEYVLVTEGECSVDVEERKLDAKKGTMFIMPAGIAHNQRGRGFARTSYVVFSADRSIADDTPRIVAFNKSEYQWVRTCIEQVRRLEEKTPRPDNSPIEGLVYGLLTYVKQVEARSMLHTSIHPALSRALNLIDSSPDRKLSAKTIAAHALVSPSYLTALFREHLGASPVHYHTTQRINRACQLLGNPYLSIKQAGYQCGFEDPNYFSRQFHKVKRCSPSRFRRNQLLKAEGRDCS